MRRGVPNMGPLYPRCVHNHIAGLLLGLVQRKLQLAERSYQLNILHTVLQSSNCTLRLMLPSVRRPVKSTALPPSVLSQSQQSHIAAALFLARVT